VSLSFSTRNLFYLTNKFDIIILFVSKACQEKEIVDQINEIYLTKRRNPEAQIIVICEINPKDYSSFISTIAETKSFSFGTPWELSKRISEMIYLKKNKLRFSF
jgi:hypothetical protein